MWGERRVNPRGLTPIQEQAAGSYGERIRHGFRFPSGDSDHRVDDVATLAALALADAYDESPEHAALVLQARREAAKIRGLDGDIIDLSYPPGHPDRVLRKGAEAAALASAEELDRGPDEVVDDTDFDDPFGEADLGSAPDVVDMMNGVGEVDEQGV